MKRDLILWNYQSPGDVLVMTAAAASLHLKYPEKFRIHVSTSCDPIWHHSPLAFDGPLKNPRTIRMEYPAIHASNAIPVHFMGAYCEFLEQQLGMPVPLAVNAPSLFLSDWERQTPIVRGEYWIVNAGVKTDFTTKGWGHANYQKVVDYLAGRVRFVQVGAREHLHPPLQNVVDLRGATTTRDLIRVCYHAAGGLGPSTFIQHIFAALGKPYVCLLGGREPVTWTHYPTQQTLSSHGMLDCCRRTSCWRSRVVPLNDGAEHDRNLCERPAATSKGEAVPKCLEMIKPEYVAYLIGRGYA